MIRDITIGQYYPADSVLHKMDPRAKLVGTLVFIISVFVFHTFPGYAVATIFLAAMIILSKVPVKFMFKGLKAIVMLLMITVVFNIFLTPGKVLWQWGILHVTEEGLKLAGRMAIRRGAHIRMTAFDVYLPKTVIKVLDILADVAVCALGIIMMVVGWNYATTLGGRGFYVSMPWLSRFWMYFPVPLAGVAMIIFEIEALYNHIKSIFVKEEV